MLNRDQVMNTQQQLFTTGMMARTSMPNTTVPSQGMTAKNTFAPATAPRATDFQMMAKQQMPMKMSMSSAQFAGSSLKPGFSPAPSMGTASRSRQFQMLAGPATSAKQDLSRSMAPKMVASTPKVNHYGFGQSLQSSASIVQNSRSKVVMSGATVTDAPTVRDLDIMSFTANRPAKTEKVENKIGEKQDVPNNLFKPKDPYMGTVVSNTTLTGPDAGEVCHIVFEHEGKLPYAEGQSIGIVAEGEDAKGKPHKLRLYSIASSAPGDYGDAKTVSLCVKRLIYEDEDGKEVKGVCSNYICDLKPGTKVRITGPVGKALLLPKDEKANVIMLATGTGIAPFRSFLWRFFMEEHPDYKFDGNAWLFMGVPTTSALLYDNEFKKMKELAGDNFKYDYAISREATDKDGNKMYIQNKMKEYGQELWDLMQKDNTYVYMCGLKGMESGIQEALGGFATKNGVEWKDFVQGLKKAGRYHVEVY